MKSILVEIKCQCGYQAYRKHETLVLSDFEVDIKQQLIENRYFTSKCPICGKVIVCIHPFLYVDKEHDFSLLLRLKEDHADKKIMMHSKINRILYDPSEFKEKLAILEDGLDDRCIELIKYSLYEQSKQQQKTVKNITYVDYDQESDTLWFDRDASFVACEMNVYRKLKQGLRDSREWECVDQAWVLRFLKESSGC